MVVSRYLRSHAWLTMLWGAWQFRMRQLLRESQQLQDVIETIPGYVWSALPDGSVDFINRRWLEFSGFSPEQALGWGWTDAVHPDDRDRFVEAWRDGLHVGSTDGSGSSRAQSRRAISLAVDPQRAAARRNGKDCQVVRQEH